MRKLYQKHLDVVDHAKCTLLRDMPHGILDVLGRSQVLHWPSRVEVRLGVLRDASPINSAAE